MTHKEYEFLKVFKSYSIQRTTHIDEEEREGEVIHIVPNALDVTGVYLHITTGKDNFLKWLPDGEAIDIDTLLFGIEAMNKGIIFKPKHLKSRGNHEN